jgi:hypothetical protein
MPLQNRVHPSGELLAVPERGTMLGNRGGKFHRDDKTLGKRRWASPHWISCELHYKDMHHEPMGRGYTSLFFLDEVTALAAGHRPCFFCRRAEAKRFVELSGMGTQALDGMLHQERCSAGALPKETMDVGVLPDGAMIDMEGVPFAVRGSHLLRWSFGGYTEAVPHAAARSANLLTPPAIVGILSNGYQPRWHASALKWGTS